MVNGRRPREGQEASLDGKRQEAIVGPDGYLMTVRDLPPSGTERWIPRRKAIVVFAVAGGLISVVEACKRYSLTVEELEQWKHSVQNHGVRGLRVTQLKQYRQLDRSRQTGHKATSSGTES
jgi:hypothetical protein